MNRTAIARLRALIRWEWAILIFFLFYCSGALGRLYQAAGLGRLEIYWFFIDSLLLAMTLVLAYERKHLLKRLPKSIVWLGSLVLLAIASISWSHDKLSSLGAVHHGLCVTLVSLYIGLRYSLWVQARIVNRAVHWLVWLSITAVLIIPGKAIVDCEYAGLPGSQSVWLGVLFYKSHLAVVAVLSVLHFIVFKRHRIVFGSSVKKAAVAYATVIAALACFWYAKSYGAILGGVIIWMTVTIANFTLIRRFLGYTLAGSILVAGLCLYGLTLPIGKPVLRAIHRTPQLSDRVTILKAALPAMEEKWLFGYGVNGVWSTSSANYIFQYPGLRGWYRHESSRTGFGDLVLDLGVAGLALFLIGYVHALVSAFYLIGRTGRADALWAMALLALVFFMNLSESNLFNTVTVFPSSLLWALYVATFVALGRQSENCN